MADFLFEIGCEEIPARMIDEQETILGIRIAKLLRDHGLFPATATVPTFSTPRRLTVLARGIRASQPDTQERVIGPSLKVAYENGKPTPAAEAFAKKVGIEISRLEKISNPKGEYLGATIYKQGRRAVEVLSELLPKEIAALNWPKNMYWREGKPERFVRPIRWIVALLDGEIIPVEFAGIKAGDESRGHRLFVDEVKIGWAVAYQDTLKKAHVIVHRTERELKVRQALDAATHTMPGARWRDDKELLDIVANLTEWPSVILGGFDREFLSLPEQVLVTVMRDHQKYFAVEDATGKLLPHFLTVLNTEGDPEGLIRHGNERVLRARFNDARFFWNSDQKVPLKLRVEGLKYVTFQKDLGNYFEKSQRVRSLAGKQAAYLKASKRVVDDFALHEAAELCKTDLSTELVKEFPELQGIVGGLYAKHQNHSQTVADAIYDHYKPHSMEDSVPRTLEGAVLSIADKADTIGGMFALGLQPTGSKDPFPLRRQANGIVKTIAGHKLRINLNQLFADSRVTYKGSEAAKKFAPGEHEDALRAFLHERLEFYLRDVRGFAYDLVNAVLAAGQDDLVDALARVEALAGVRDSKDFEAISVSFKRVKNILRQARESKFVVGEEPIRALRQEDAERSLLDQVSQISTVVETHRKAGDYRSALTEISKIRPALDSFFDKVMVMVEGNRDLRANRLALLQKLLADFSTIADFSEIVIEKK
ncbi:MAG: glycine--tRNA ligase subunit beta [Acidobacteria bacterium]|nr:MAG: glycine--tRNA ligase subunit beta [Acidobacteriota bacterium]